MVVVSEIFEEEETTTTTIPSPSQERQRDADEIESLCAKYATRPSVKAHLTSLVSKIRRDAQAMKRMEDSRSRMEMEEEMSGSGGKKEEKVEMDGGKEEEKVVVEEVTSASPAPAAVASTPTPTPTTSSIAATAPNPSPSQKYKSIDKFAFDSGSYNSPTVTIYITSLSQIGSIPKSNITCDFTKTSFDLKIHNYVDGCDYRLLKDNLEKDIDPTKSKIIVKSSKIVIKLGKIKGEYGSYDSWMDLTSKKSKESKKAAKSDPSASIMEMMKEMYDNGDDNMKKMIGETMLKQREGKLKDGPGGSGMDGMGDL